MGSVPTTSQAAARADPLAPKPNLPAPIVPNQSLIGHTMPTAPPPHMLNNKDPSNPDSNGASMGYKASRTSLSGSAAISRHNPM